MVKEALSTGFGVRVQTKVRIRLGREWVRAGLGLRFSPGGGPAAVGIAAHIALPAATDVRTPSMAIPWS